MMVLYAATVVISALLLFLIQPLIGRYVLPWFGGSSAVWSAVQLFFQLLLLAGYAYSHVVMKQLARRRQVFVHSTILVLSLGLMSLNSVTWQTPITPGHSWEPQPSQSPLIQILLTLAASVGLPYFVLSTTSPLLQAWFAKRFPGHSPYPLYALSNAGSIVALLAYPLALEPAMTVRGQAWLWSAGFLVFALGVVVILAEPGRPDPGPMDVTPSESLDPKSPRRRPLLWLGFSACGSTLLLGATNQMTQNVATVPLLWVVPLVLYLLTFVIVFATDRPVSRWSLGLLLVAMPAFRGALVLGNGLPISVQLGAYALIVFAGCMVSHGEVARLRPKVRQLTSFYLITAAGGALGGLFVNFVAPWIFLDFYELPVGVTLCWLLALISLVAERRAIPVKFAVRHGWTMVLALLGVLYAGSIVFASVAAFNRTTLDAARNFYGTQRVQTLVIRQDVAPSGDGEAQMLAYRLIHGTTVHGVQFVDADRRRELTSYFCPSSGIGLAWSQAVLRKTSGEAAVLGLGAGTLAAYGRRGDTIIFYEIDPQVIAYAEGEGGYFSYLAESGAAIDIVEGDARLMLERELAADGARGYDLLAVDVFSGDSPPVHLLTREALDVYLAHLAPDGLLAMNISTTHIDLKRVVAGLARDAGLSGLIVEDVGDGKACFPSRWVVMSRQADLLSGSQWRAYPDLDTAFDPGLRLWTDGYSNLSQILLLR